MSDSTATPIAAISSTAEALRVGRAELMGIVRRQLRQRWAQMLLGVGALLALLVVDLLAPWPLKLVVDTVLLDRPLPPELAWSAPVFAHGDLLALGVLASVIAGFAVLSGVFAYAQTFIGARIGYEITHAVRTALFTRLSQLSLAFHARTRSGELLTRVGADTTLIRDLFADWVVKAVADAALIGGILVVMFLMNWQLGVLVACALPLLFVALRRITRAIRNTARAQRKQDGELTSRLNEALSSMQLIQAFGRETHEQQRFEYESELSRDAGIHNARASALVSRAVGLIAALATAATVMLGGLFVVRGTLTPGDLLVFLAYVAALFKPVRDLGKLVSKFSRARVSADRLAELLAVKPTVRERADAADAGRAQGALSFHGVRFAYDDGRPVLDAIELTIRAGEHIAIIGSSGAGKSTLLRLALRLDDPQAGEIRLDDRPIQLLTLSSLRREVGVVLQDTALLGATIAENIAFGDPDATQARIEAAARLAGVHDFIASLPQGYATPLGERGATLSGGQRQRICIARTLVRDPAVLILDEPTSAVDPAMAAWIEGTITAHRRGRTTVVMGHQFTSFAAFDRVLEVRGGAIHDVTARVRTPTLRALPGQVA